jgi:hypothetical protein
MAKLIELLCPVLTQLGNKPDEVGKMPGFIGEHKNYNFVLQSWNN